MSIECPKMQKLMDEAYSRWDAATMDRTDFWDQLSPDERTAVFLGNLNYQVENGGWCQWADNGYMCADTVGFIHRACRRIGTDATKAVSGMLSWYEHLREKLDAQRGDYWDEEDPLLAEEDKLCSEFYAINEQFMADVEATLP